MTYQDFQETIISNLKAALPASYQISVKKILKNNQLTLHGLLISNSSSNIAPTIYLEYYYDQYKEGQSLETITSNILNTYKTHKCEHDFDISFFTNFETVKEKIVFKLIHFENNRKLLEDIPYIKYLDLAIVFYCIVDFQSSEDGSILICNNHLKLWNVSCDDIYQLAIKNTPLLRPYHIENMKDLLSQANAIDSPLCSDAACGEPFMYVLTNNTQHYGASCILYKDILRDFAAFLGQDLFVLPSSIHEVILIPCESHADIHTLSEIVKDVNVTQLREEDVLSDHAYYFSLSASELSCQ